MIEATPAMMSATVSHVVGLLPTSTRIGFAAWTPPERSALPLGTALRARSSVRSSRPAFHKVRSCSTCRRGRRRGSQRLQVDMLRRRLAVSPYVLSSIALPVADDQPYESDGQRKTSTRDARELTLDWVMDVSSESPKQNSSICCTEDFARCKAGSRCAASDTSRVAGVATGFRIARQGKDAPTCLIGMQRERDLLEVVRASSLPRSLARRLNGREQEPDKDCENANHDEQLDQGESGPFHRVRSCFICRHGRLPVEVASTR